MIAPASHSGERRGHRDASARPHEGLAQPIHLAKTSRWRDGERKGVALQNNRTPRFLPDNVQFLTHIKPTSLSAAMNTPRAWPRDPRQTYAGFSSKCD